MQRFGDREAAVKLTWFGGKMVRVHIGGLILVVDPEGAPPNVDRVELLSGADRIVAGELARIDLATWRPRRSGRLLDESEEPCVLTWSDESGTILIEAIGEAPLLLVSGCMPKLGRWVESAVVVLFGSGEALVELGLGLLVHHAPRLLALAESEQAVDFAVLRLRGHLDGTSLVALEAGLSLEV